MTAGNGPALPDPRAALGVASSPPPPDLRKFHQALLQADSLRTSGRLAEARRALESLVAAAPNYVEAWKVLGAVTYASNDVLTALSCFHRAVMLNGEDVAALLELTRCYQATESFDLAAITLAAAEKLDPAAWATLAARARLSFGEQRYEAALESASQARRLRPQQAEFAHLCGECFRYAGDSKAAADCYIEALRIEKSRDRTSTFIPRLLYSIAQHRLAADRVDLLAEVGAFESARSQISADTRTRLGYVRSIGLELAGRFPEAWRTLQAANTAVWSSGAMVEAVKARQMNAASLENARRSPTVRQRDPEPETPVALFITGPSRSGKSTIEAMISRGFAGVRRTYERTILEFAVLRTAQANQLPGVTHFQALPPSLHRKFGDRLRHEIRAAAMGSAIVTNTHPGSIHHAGGVAQTFPNAFFIFVTRDEDDNALRCLQKIYETGNAYSYDLVECRAHLRWYREMMDAWAAKMPANCLAVSYEEIVTEPARVLATLSSRIGVPLVDTHITASADDRSCAEPYRSMMTTPAAASG